MKIRTRFAPSPTGYLHIGGARTALYCWLFAKHSGGEFLLRIEDTDRERSTQESIDAILDGIQWLGLDYAADPIYQTQRFDRYKEVIQSLIDKGEAYPCFCSKERLETLRETQMAKKLKPRYDGHCRNLENPDLTQPHVIRFKNPEEGSVVFEDLVRGSVAIQNRELDDLIIARTDGTPTYNLTVVVDDWDMQITHVIRGDDHINNTPRQINILKALNAELPIYAHLPMILGEDGKRLSKRHGAVSVMEYRKEGFLPQALLNYLARLGWSHGDQEIFSLAEMVDYFELAQVNNSPAAMNRSKLVWLNQQYIKSGNPDNLVKELEWHCQNLGINTENGPALSRVLEALSERVETLKEMAEKAQIFYQEYETLDEGAAKKHLRGVVLEPLRALQTRYQEQQNWVKEDLHDIIIVVAEQFEQKMGKIAQPLRVAVTGSSVSPPIDITLELLGPQRVNQGLEKAIAYIEARMAQES